MKNILDKLDKIQKDYEIDRTTHLNSCEKCKQTLKEKLKSEEYINGFRVIGNCFAFVEECPDYMMEQILK